MLYVCFIFSTCTLTPNYNLPLLTLLFLSPHNVTCPLTSQTLHSLCPSISLPLHVNSPHSFDLPSLPKCPPVKHAYLFIFSDSSV